MKTGRMYVVWPAEPDIKSAQNGIEKVIESIEGTRGQYGWCKEVISEIAGNRASEQAGYMAEEVTERDDQGHWRGHHIIDDERNGLKGRYIQEFGQRAVYEVRVRYVGKVDAQGRFTEVKPKKKVKRK